MGFSKVKTLNSFSGEEAVPVTDPLDRIVLEISREACCNIAFKGGWMLNKIMNNSRLTHDVDFSIDDKNAYEGIKGSLIAIAEKFKSDGVVAEYRVKDSIGEHSSGGIDMYDSSGTKILGVDVGYHRLDYGVRVYHLNFVDVNGFEIERMLSDKLIAILSRKRFRRTKDLYDFYAITSQFDFFSSKLRRYVDLRGGAEWDNIPFSDIVLREYEKAWDKLVLISSTEVALLEKPSFESAITRFNIISFYLKESDCTLSWDHSKLGFCNVI